MQQLNQDQMTLGFKKLVHAVLAKANTNVDATTWEGQTKADFQAALKTLFQGTTTLTTAQVDAKVEQVIADLAAVDKNTVGLGNVQNFGIATKLEAEDSLNDAAYLTPRAGFELVKKWFADEASTNPETLDTIAEFGTAIAANQNSLDTLNTLAGTKADKATFEAHVQTFNDTMANLWASAQDVTDGTATDKVMSVAQTTAAIGASSDADSVVMQNILAETLDHVNGVVAWPAEVTA